MTPAAGVAHGLPRLRPYQAQVARAIIERVTRRSGGSLSVEIARQGGKNELSAQVELLVLLMGASAGGTLVKCAPTLDPQARISFRRLRDRATAAGLERMVRPAGPAALRCGRAEARFLSAEPTANVVGHTADLLLEVDEAQDVQSEKFDRDFRPMAASTDAPIVFYGTPWGARSLLEQAKAHHLEQERADGQRRHFRFDWEQVAACVPAYGRYVEGERARLGERHPLFRTQYLLEVVEEVGRLFDAAALAGLEGRHGPLKDGQPSERYVAGLDLGGPARDGDPAAHDWTVLTIARVRPAAAREDGEKPLGPTVQIVKHRAWQGTATETLVREVLAELDRGWHAHHLSVDATGLGGPIADLLAARLPRGVVEPVVFSSERKTQLGFGLLAAVHAGRLTLYRAGSSVERAECRRQLELARAVYRDERAMQFHVDPAEGHDDYLMSLALAVDAARHTREPRAARGRVAGMRTVQVERTKGGQHDAGNDRGTDGAAVGAV